MSDPVNDALTRQRMLDALAKAFNSTEGDTLYQGENLPYKIRGPEPVWQPPKQKFSKRLRNISRWRQ